MIRFFYNGMKCGDGNNGELEKARFWIQSDESIMVYADSYCAFSKEIQETFSVKNDSDHMTDYFCKDSFSILPSDKHYTDAMLAVTSYDLRKAKRMLKKFPTQAEWKVKLEETTKKQTELLKLKEHTMKVAPKAVATTNLQHQASAQGTEQVETEVEVEFDEAGQLIVQDAQGNLIAPQGLRRKDFEHGILHDKEEGFALSQDQEIEVERRWLAYNILHAERKLQKELEGHTKRVADHQAKICSLKLALEGVGKVATPKDEAASSLKKTIAKLEKMGLSKADILAAIEELQ